MKQAQIIAMMFAAVVGLVAVGQTKISGPMPAKDGEICIVCYGRTTTSDLAYTVNGERYAVMKGLEEDFLKSPDDYIRKYKARQASLGGKAAAKTVESSTDSSLYAGLGLLVVGLSALFWWLDRKRRSQGKAV